jgi:hypothetical protein
MIRFELKRRPLLRTLRGLADSSSTPYYEICSPRDSACVERNSNRNTAYALQEQAQRVGENFNQCEANAQNASSPAQYAEVMANCKAQAEIQAAPMMQGDQWAPIYIPPAPAYGAAPVYVATENYDYQQTTAPTSQTYQPANASEVFIHAAGLPANVTAAVTSPTATTATVFAAAAAAAAAAPAAAKVYTPRLAFTNTTSGGSNTQLKTGEYWQVVITGGAPNTAVIVVGGKDGAQDVVTSGTTGADGTFRLSGQLTAAEIGTWAELWRVGTTEAGRISFTVSAAAAPTPAGGTPPAGTPDATPPDSTTPPAGSFQLPAALTGLPWYAWAGAAAAAVTLLQAFTGGRRR